MNERHDGLPGLLVCQETLQPVEVGPEGLWSTAAERLYPVRDALVYCGYPAKDQSMIATTMEEERAWQATTETLDRDAQFLQQSAPAAVKFINLVTSYVSATTPIVVELGCGSGWVSWLLAEAGYDPYLCDFEANSLVLGQEFEHSSLTVGKRVVCDARYAPFGDQSFDVVLFRGFVHHVEDFETLFREANRLLRPGGVLALMEPTMSVAKWGYELRHPDPHEGHHITWPLRYLRALSRCGFELAHATALLNDHVPRNPIRRALKRRAARRVEGLRQLAMIDYAHLHLLGGGSLIVIARKDTTLPAHSRPKMTLIEPSTMTTTPADRKLYGDKLVGIVRDAARGLRQARTRSNSGSDLPRLAPRSDDP